MCTRRKATVSDPEICPESDKSRLLLSYYLKKKYPERFHRIKDGHESLKDLFNTLCPHGFNTISKLHKALERTKEAVERFEQEFPPDVPGEYRYKASGIAKLSIRLLYYEDLLKASNFRRRGLDHDKLKEYQTLIFPETES